MRETTVNIPQVNTLMGMLVAALCFGILVYAHPVKAEEVAQDAHFSVLQEKLEKLTSLVEELQSKIELRALSGQQNALLGSSHSFFNSPSKTGIQNSTGSTLGGKMYGSGRVSGSDRQSTSGSKKQRNSWSGKSPASSETPCIPSSRSNYTLGDRVNCLDSNITQSAVGSSNSDGAQSDTETTPKNSNLSGSSLGETQTHTKRPSSQSPSEYIRDLRDRRAELLEKYKKQQGVRSKSDVRTSSDSEDSVGTSIGSSGGTDTPTYTNTPSTQSSSRYILDLQTRVKALEKQVKSRGQGSTYDRSPEESESSLKKTDMPNSAKASSDSENPAGSSSDKAEAPSKAKRFHTQSQSDYLLDLRERVKALEKQVKSRGQGSNEDRPAKKSDLSRRKADTSNDTETETESSQNLKRGGFLFGTNMGIGSRGEQVKNLQECLADLGYFDSSNSADVFGPKTRKAVQKFQSSNSIVHSGSEWTTGFGYLGPKTRSILNSQCK